MHRVQCPHCQKSYELRSPVRAVRMKCGQCGQVFVGTSVAVPDAGAPAVSPPPAAPAAPAEAPPPQAAAAPAQAAPVIAVQISPSALLAQRQRRQSRSVMIVCGLVLVGIAVAAVLLWYAQTHLVMETKDPRTGIVTRVRVSTEEYQRRKAEEKAKQAEADKPAPAPARAPEPAPVPMPAPTTTSPAPAAAPPASMPTPATVPDSRIKTDPQLDVSQELVASGVLGDERYVVGRILSQYGAGFADVTVTAYVRGAAMEPVTYPYLPAKGVLQYSVKLAVATDSADDVKVSAVVGKPLTDLVAWNVDDVRFDTQEDELIVTGWVTNRADATVKLVKVYCDLFTADGIWLGRSAGDVPKPLGIGKTERFEASFSKVIAPDTKVVARAVGQKDSPFR